MALIFFPLALPDVQQQKPFLEEIHSEFTESLNTYVGGAMAFSKEVVKMLFDQNGQTLLEDGGEKKGTLIFTETLGAMRTNANFAAYGASRSGARSLAQALAKEYSPSGIHVVHTIANYIAKSSLVSLGVKRVTDKPPSFIKPSLRDILANTDNFFSEIMDEDGEAQQQGKVMKAESVG
ncbi:MAG: hypothetical protein Q9161_008451 [Pseudevernia consocians]